MSLKKYRNKYKKHIFEHFHELQTRLKVYIFFLICASVLGFFINKHIIKYIVNVFPKETQINFLNSSDAFITSINTSFFFGLIITLPIILYQVYKFLCPAFRKSDRRFLRNILISSNLLFIFGTVVLNEFLTKNAVEFFINYSKKIEINTIIDAKNYISSIMFYSFCFGGLMQFPIPIIILAKYKIIQTQDLKNFRRFFIALSFVISGVITPPDVLGQVICAILMIALYEILIILCKKYDLRE